VANGPKTVRSPEAGLYRLGHRGQGSFEPPDWNYQDPDGTFGNRFDDPLGSTLQRDQCFRVVYCATDRVAAFGETLARFRTSLPLLAGLASVSDDDPVEESLAGSIDPKDSGRVVVGADWQTQRMVTHTVLEPSLLFVDLTAAETIQYLRRPLAAVAHSLGLPDIDEAAVIGPNRAFTQRVARYLYEQCDDEGHPLYAGIRYCSRLDLEWECWALYADRMKHLPGMPALSETIFPDDPDLMKIASLWGLTIEGLRGSGQYYRP
jgi:hypothetical protein